MKVLLIDDDMDDGMLMQEVLEQIDPAVIFTHYQNSQEALETLTNTHAEVPDLIFLDINMPIVNGWHCLDVFKRTPQLKEVPIYMFTTSSRKIERDNSLQSGAAGFITKPDDYRILKQVLTETLDKVKKNRP